MDPTLAALQAGLVQNAALIQAITSNPKPSYSIDGESMSWAEYFRVLTEADKAIRRSIQEQQGAFQVISQLRT